MTITRRAVGTGLAAALLAACALAVVPGAHGHEAAFDSRVTIRTSDGVVYRGRVISESDRCEPGRTVKLYRRQPGPDLFIGEDTTNAEGRWSINTGPGTNYYAKVVRKVITRPGHRHVCRADRSRTIQGY